MYAVIKTGGKQYRVEEGEFLRVEKLDAEAGDKVELTEVLMLVDGSDVQIGSPMIEGAIVNATIRKQGRGEKVKIIKFHRRKHYRRQAGHRQNYTEILIDSIAAKGANMPLAKKIVAPATAKPVAKKADLKAKATAKDDLKNLSGVGPKLAEKLNAYGITTYSEVAKFTKKRMAEVDAKLNLKGRIERDDWKAQAKILAAGGETEFSKKK